MVKFVPNVENIQYDYEKNVLIRENVRMILNPDDACAVAFALKMKEKNPEINIEVVTMAPKTVVPYVQDLLRRNVDKATIISDNLYVGSDTYVTSKILATYLENQKYDCIFTGTQSLDGDTSHVPAQVGELLNISQMSNIIKIHEELFNKNKAVFEVEDDDKISTYEITLPAILSIRKESNYKLPYIKYENLSLDVSDKLNIISNNELGLKEEDVGINGSLTRVANTYSKQFKTKDRTIVRNDEQGIEYVYSFLKKKGFV
jgi:electron transfer flavoprotein beta subunit